jgi:hypothetical protein
MKELFAQNLYQAGASYRREFIPYDKEFNQEIFLIFIIPYASTPQKHLKLFHDSNAF